MVNMWWLLNFFCYIWLVTAVAYEAHKCGNLDFRFSPWELFIRLILLHLGVLLLPGLMSWHHFQSPCLWSMLEGLLVIFFAPIICQAFAHINHQIWLNSVESNCTSHALSSVVFCNLDWFFYVNNCGYLYDIISARITYLFEENHILSPSSFTLFSLPFPEYMKDYHILGNCPYGADLAKQLATMLQNILWSCGSIRISFSRRTPEKVYML